MPCSTVDNECPAMSVSNPIGDLKKKSLKISFVKGLFGCCMTGFTQEYFTPFLLFLGAGANHVGILSAATNFFASIIQFFSAEMVNKLRSRKRMIGLFVLLQAGILFLMPLLAPGRGGSYWIFIALAVLFTSFGAVLIPAWLSFLSDLVDEERRGDYFGWRGRNLGLVTLGAMLSAGVILHVTEKTDVALGFIIIFALAGVCRLLSLVFLGRMYEPPLICREEDSFTFIRFIARLKESNFAKFVLFVALMNFSVNLAAPFFAVLMIRDLSFPYMTYTGIMMAAPLMVFLTVHRWGRHADIVGNLKVIRFTAVFIPLIPVLWIVNRNPLFLIFVEMAAGFLWAGFNLCAANFIYDAVSPQKRTRCIAYFHVVNGLALSFGALLGGSIVGRLPPFAGFKTLTLFLISAALRLCVAAVLPPFLKEVRSVTSVKSSVLFLSLIGVRPIHGLDKAGIVSKMGK